MGPRLVSRGYKLMQVLMLIRQMLQWGRGL